MSSLKPWLMLLLIAAICGALLQGAYSLTRTPIEDNREQARRAVLVDLLKADRPDIGLPVQDVSTGTCNDILVTLVSTPGYAGEIEWLVASQPDAMGVVRISMRATRHLETPGIGDFINGEWLSALDESPRNNWATLDGVSGATITFNAVRTAALQAFTHFETHCLEKEVEGDGGGEP